MPRILVPNSIYPLVHFCTMVGCHRTGRGLALNKAEQRQAVLYTLDKGALPVWSVHLYCEGVDPIVCYHGLYKCSTSLLECKVNYHHNFYVPHGGQRHYFSTTPDVIQVGDHQFVETKVINLWIGMMLMSWTSATNCARLYNSSLSSSQAFPSGWSFGSELKSDHVYNGFMILSLMEDATTRREQLVIPHAGLDKDRFKQAIQARNTRMRLYNQPEIRHYCKKCTRFLSRGEISARIYLFLLEINPQLRS
jgi:hypothetical protein